MPLTSWRPPAAASGNTYTRSTPSHMPLLSSLCIRRCYMPDRLHVTRGSVPHTLAAVPHRKDHCPLRLVASAQPETEEQRSPLDAPQEWEAPQPSRRPDIFPEFEKMEKVFLPKPLPGDPEMPDEEAEEAVKRTLPGDPDPEQKPGEPPELPEQPRDPGQDPERTDIPNIPD